MYILADGFEARVFRHYFPDAIVTSTCPKVKKQEIVVTSNKVTESKLENLLINKNRIVYMATGRDACGILELDRTYNNFLLLPAEGLSRLKALAYCRNLIIQVEKLEKRTSGRPASDAPASVDDPQGTP
jgi:hypothetical protein